MLKLDDWNSLVPPENRLESPNCDEKRPAPIPTHIVIHITGTNNFEKAKTRFMTSEEKASAHYVVAPEGDIFQFVPDRHRAWHAGINKQIAALYRQGRGVWQKYLQYYSRKDLPAAKYPEDALYFTPDRAGRLIKTRIGQTPAFVMRADEAPWPHYDYFNSRWPDLDMPVNFAVDENPNNYSIGIEIVGYGAKTADPKAYTPAMYTSLRLLVNDLSGKYSIPLTKDRVVGHDDVNPIARWYCDPGKGFDWKSVLD